MFEEYGALAPLRDAAELLAEHDWPRLYDEARLAANDVPVAAAIYAEDMYVEREFSEQTAAQIRGLRPWLTNEFHHDGLRMEADRVLGRLIDLMRGRVRRFPGRRGKPPRSTEAAATRARPGVLAAGRGRRAVRGTVALGITSGGSGGCTSRRRMVGAPRQGWAGGWIHAMAKRFRRRPAFALRTAGARR